MAKPLIFTISPLGTKTRRYERHCDDIPAAADAPSLDELFAKISAICSTFARQSPDADPASLYL